MLANLFVIEEAHQLLKAGDDRSDLSFGAVSTMAVEGRKYGIGMLLVEQSPSLLPVAIASNCYLRVCLGAKSGEDAKTVANMMGLDRQQMEFLLAMPVRAAVIHHPGSPEPFLFQILAARTADGGITEEEVRRATDEAIANIPWTPAPIAEKKGERQKELFAEEKRVTRLPWEEEEYLLMVARQPFVPASARDLGAKIALAKGNSLRQRLRAKGLLEEAQVSVGRGGRVLVVAPSNAGWRYLEGIGTPVQKPAGRGGLAHCFAQFIIAGALAKRYPGAQVKIEDGSLGKSVDVSVVVEEQGQVRREAYEVLVKGEGKEITNIVQDLDVGYDVVTVCCETVEALESLRERCRRELKIEELERVRFSLVGEFWKED